MADEEYVNVIRTISTISKIDRYGWKIEDEPGSFSEIDKNDLFIEEKYQRDPALKKIMRIAASWSWIACGIIIVGLRDGKYWIIDGQHRVLAAKKREDIVNLPCLVFIITSIREEARGFVGANTNRKSMSGFQKFKADIAAENLVAMYVDDLMSRFDIKIRKTRDGSRSLESIGCLLTQASENRTAFEAVIRTVDKLFGKIKIKKSLLEGLFFIHNNCKQNLDNVVMQKRIIKIGVEKLSASILRATLFYERSGRKVYAYGILAALNKNIRNKFILKN